ncbi:MAG TPA: hypothetical protein VL282_04620, partial [Tepidisphaeraceae bacterium]|nr:hypothetical protein [Tepidisphaeraceae bacterium]
HHYASAPLAVSPFAVTLVAVVGLLAGNAHDGPWFYAVVIAVALSVGSIIFMMWLIPQLLMRAGTGCTPRRARSLALYLPLHWAIMMILAVLIFCVFIVPPAWYFSD